MATLHEIVTTGMANVVPTPVMSYAINNYLVNDAYMNMQEFVPIGTYDNLGNIKASVPVYNEAGEAAFRQIGSKYESTASKVEPKVITLKALGGSFPIDKILIRSFNNNPISLGNWVEQQTLQKMNAIVNTFGLASFKDITGGFGNNINKYFVTNSGQVVEPFVLSGLLSINNALMVESYINEVISLLRTQPNVCYTTRRGAALAKTLNGHRNAGIKAVNVNDREYNQILNIALVEVPDNWFSDADIEKGLPFVFGYINKVDGIRYAIPMDGKLIDIVLPKWTDGEVVNNGTVEVLAAPIMEDSRILAKGYIKEVPEGTVGE